MYFETKEKVQEMSNGAGCLAGLGLIGSVLSGMAMNSGRGPLKVIGTIGMIGSVFTLIGSSEVIGECNQALQYVEE